MSIEKFIKHYFFPHESNNQKAKLLHSSSLLLIALVLLGYQLLLYFLPKSGVKILGYAANISVDEVIRLTNEQRVSQGLSPLEYNSTLASAARAKGADMINRDYWAHVAPDGTEPWKFFKDAGYSYRFAGENLARDFSNAPSAVEAWMASPTHKENILSSKYKEIGVAVVEGDLAGADTTIIVQLFGTKYADTVPAVPVAQKTSATEVPVASLEASPIAVAALAPSPSPTSPALVLVETVPTQKAVPVSSPMVLVSPFTSTKSISLVVVVMLLLVSVVDGLVTSRRRIARIGGRTFAHLSFLGMILAIALILKAGKIL